MNPLERASKLRQEADLVLQKVGVYDIRYCPSTSVMNDLFLA
jgi:hypothetical protein